MARESTKNPFDLPMYCIFGKLVLKFATMDHLLARVNATLQKGSTQNHVDYFLTVKKKHGDCFQTLKHGVRNEY